MSLFVSSAVSHQSHSATATCFKDSQLATPQRANSENDRPKSTSLKNDLCRIMELKASKIAELLQLKSLSQLCEHPNNAESRRNLADMYQHISIITSTLQEYELKIQQISKTLGLSSAESLYSDLDKEYEMVNITTFSGRQPYKNFSTTIPLLPQSLRSLLSLPIDKGSDDEVANITANCARQPSESSSSTPPFLPQPMRAPSTEPEIKATPAAPPITLPTAPLMQEIRHTMLPTLVSFAQTSHKTS